MGVYQTIDNVLEAEVTPSAKLVAIALFRHENRKTGLCFPSVTTLCELTGLKMTAVKTALKILRSEGLIKWESKVPKFGNSKTNHYTLVFVDRSESDYMNNRTPNQSPNRTPNQSPNRTESDHEQIEQNKQAKQKERPPYPLEGGNDILTPETQMPAKKKKRGFEPPTVEQVSQYCKSRNNGIDPEYFVDFYASKGWMVGKNKMKEWKAAVRNWERSEPGRGKPKVSKTPGIKAKYCDENGNFDINKIL